MRSPHEPLMHIIVHSTHSHIALYDIKDTHFHTLYTPILFFFFLHTKSTIRFYRFLLFFSPLFIFIALVYIHRSWGTIGFRNVLMPLPITSTRVKETAWSLELSWQKKKRTRFRPKTFSLENFMIAVPFTDRIVGWRHLFCWRACCAGGRQSEGAMNRKGVRKYGGEAALIFLCIRLDACTCYTETKWRATNDLGRAVDSHLKILKS